MSSKTTKPSKSVKPTTSSKTATKKDEVSSVTPPTLPEGFGLFKHPGTGITFAEYRRISDDRVKVLVPRREGSNPEWGIDAVCAHDALRYLDDEKASGKKVTPSHAKVMAPDEHGVHFLIPV